MRTVSSQQAAQMIGVSPGRLRQWAQDGVILAEQDPNITGRVYRRYPLAEVMRIIANRSFLTTKQVVMLTGVTRRTVFRWVRAGRLVPIGTGRVHQFRREDVMRLVEERKGRMRLLPVKPKPKAEPVRKIYPAQPPTRRLSLPLPLQPVPLVEDWRPKAACLGIDTEVFFAQSAGQEAGKHVCKDCPVRYECLADALDGEVAYGLFGGMTDRERRKLLNRNSHITSWWGLFEGLPPRVQS